jgi:cytochrome c556
MVCEQCAKTNGLVYIAENFTGKTAMKYLVASVSILLAGMTLPAQAQFAKAEDAIKYRQSALFVMGQHFSRLAAMAQGKIPFDAKAAADNAAVVESMSKLPWAAFGEGTDQGGNTKAKPEIWSDNAKFKEAADKMMAEVVKLGAAAKTGKADELKSAVSATGGTCKNCHDNFRNK